LPSCTRSVKNTVIQAQQQEAGYWRCAPRCERNLPNRIKSARPCWQVDGRFVDHGR
jgi:hypothetical protein